MTQTRTRHAPRHAPRRPGAVALRSAVADHLFDDFDRGFSGWTQLVGNYEHTLDTMLPGYAQLTAADAVDAAALGHRQPRRASTAPTR